MEFQYKNDGMVSLKLWRDGDKSKLVSDAVVKATVLNEDETPVAGEWPVTIAPVDGEPGMYAGYVPTADALQLGDFYILQLEYEDPVTGQKGSKRRRGQVKSND